MKTDIVELQETVLLSSFADHLDELYGVPGTATREAYEAEFEAFKLEIQIGHLKK